MQKHQKICLKSNLLCETIDWGRARIEIAWDSRNGNRLGSPKRTGKIPGHSRRGISRRRGRDSNSHLVVGTSTAWLKAKA